MAPKPPNVRSSPAEPWRFSGVVDRAGVPQRVAMQISRHRTEKMFQRYAIIDEQDLRTAMQRITMYQDTLPVTKERLP